MTKEIEIHEEEYFHFKKVGFLSLWLFLMGGLLIFGGYYVREDITRFSQVAAIQAFTSLGLLCFYGGYRFYNN